MLVTGNLVQTTTNALRTLAIVLLFINSISAFAGGIGLMLDPSGEMMQLPLEWLEHTPFSDFFIPGFILLVFIGIFSLAVGFLTIFKVKRYPYFIIFEGLVLIIWLTVEIIMIKFFFAPLHLSYYAVGIGLVGCGWKLRN